MLRYIYFNNLYFLIMNENDLKVGDVVTFILAGPIMIVYAILGEGIVRCKWFASDVLQVGDFHVTSLKKVQDPIR